MEREIALQQGSCIGKGKDLYCHAENLIEKEDDSTGTPLRCGFPACGGIYIVLTGHVFHAFFGWLVQGKDAALKTG